MKPPLQAGIYRTGAMCGKYTIFNVYKGLHGVKNTHKQGFNSLVLSTGRIRTDTEAGI